MTEVTYDEPFKRAIAEFELSDFGYGDIIPKQWLNEALNIPLPASMSDAALEEYHVYKFAQKTKFKDHLLFEWKMKTETVRGEGLKILDPNHQVKSTMETFAKHVGNATKNAERSLSHVNERALTSANRKNLMDARAKLSMIKGLTRRTLKISYEDE